MDNLDSMFKRIKKFGLEFVGLYYSSYPGIVADNRDPSGQNRLFIIVPGIFGYPSKPIWFYPKGLSPLVNNIPAVGDTVIVEFDNGRPSTGKWSYSAPLKGAKPEEFRSDKVYAFKSPGGHLLMIDEIDNLITLKHKDGQIITIGDSGINIDAGDSDIILNNSTSSISISDSGIDIDSDNPITIGGSKEVLYSKIPNATQILDVSQIGVSTKVTVG